MGDEQWFQVLGITGGLAFAAMVVRELFVFLKRPAEGRDDRVAELLAELVSELRLANAALARIEATQAASFQRVRDQLHAFAQALTRAPREVADELANELRGLSSSIVERVTDRLSEPWARRQPQPPSAPPPPIGAPEA